MLSCTVAMSVPAVNLLNNAIIELPFRYRVNELPPMETSRLACEGHSLVEHVGFLRHDRTNRELRCGV